MLKKLTCKTNIILKTQRIFFFFFWFILGTLEFFKSLFLSKILDILKLILTLKLKWNNNLGSEIYPFHICFKDRIFFFVRFFFSNIFFVNVSDIEGSTHKKSIEALIVAKKN